MQNMNRQLNLPQIQKILHEFEKQSEIMDMKEEMINEHIDDAMEDEGDEEETDAVVVSIQRMLLSNKCSYPTNALIQQMQVLDELGLQLNDQLSGLPQVNSRTLLCSSCWKCETSKDCVVNTCSKRI